MSLTRRRLGDSMKGTTKVIVGGNGVPPEPDWKETYRKKSDRNRASTEWGTIIREMKERQTLTVACGHIIKRLVDYRILYDRAMSDVLKNGCTKGNSNSNQNKWNENWSVVRACEGFIKSCESELGLNPTRRGAAHKVKGSGGESKANAYLK